MYLIGLTYNNYLYINVFMCGGLKNNDEKNFRQKMAGRIYCLVNFRVEFP
jgi:hypothetical protein